MYRLIDHIGLNIPPAGPCHRGVRDGAAGPAADLPEGSIFMRSQNGPAKAKLLNMHTKALIRPFDKLV